MEWNNLIAVLFAGAGFLWSIFRDKTKDMEELENRLTILEVTVSTHSTEIGRLEKSQGELEVTIKNIQDQIHKLDLKIERILTILERNKGA